MHIGNDGWLVEDVAGLPPVSRVPSVRSTPFTVDLKAPLGLVWHWTGGPAKGPAYAQALADEIRGYNKLKDRAASWHFLVAKDGRIIQSIQTDRGSWHVGRPGRIGGPPQKTNTKWEAITGWAGRLFSNVNSATIGVELENSGRLMRDGDKFYCWPYYIHPDHPEGGFDHRLEIPRERTVLHGGQWFDDFQLDQELAAARLLTACLLKFKWDRHAATYGHVMFDPARREDPGPVWLDVVLPRILDRVFGPK